MIACWGFRMLAQTLKPIWRRIAEEYIRDYNAKRVAGCVGMSPGAVSQAVKRPEVQEYIEWLEANRSVRTAVTADRVLLELARIGLVDPRKLVQVDADGQVRITPTDQLSEDDAACIEEIATTGTGVRVKIHNKLNALEKLGKHLGMFTDVVDQRLSVQAMPAVVVDGVEIDFDIGAEPDSAPKLVEKDDSHGCD